MKTCQIERNTKQHYGASTGTGITILNLGQHLFISFHSHAINCVITFEDISLVFELVWQVVAKVIRKCLFVLSSLLKLFVVCCK